MEHRNVFQIRKLTLEEIIFIYNKHLVHDFPKSEVKPLELIIQGFHDQRYEAYGLYDQKKELYGYAFLICHTKRNIMLLDYYAITGAHRSQGAGSIFLQKLSDEYRIQDKEIYLEIENPACASDEESRQLRMKRKKFYEQNQVKVSNVTCCFLTDEYCILHIGAFKSDEEVKQDIFDLYCDFFGSQFVNKNVIFHE